MPIQFTCAECGTFLDVDDSLAGKTIRCRDCHGLNRVPSRPNLPDLAIVQKAAPTAAKPPSSAAAKTPEPERPPRSPFRVLYHCPFCQSSQKPVWETFWTPTSTLVVIALLPFICLLVYILMSLLLFLLSIAGGRAAEVAASWVGMIAGAAGVTLLISVCVFPMLIRSPLVREQRQVCPDCEVRLS